MFQRFAFQQLHSDEMLAVHFVDFINSADVGMIQSRGGKGFTLKTFARRRIVLHFVRKEF